MRKYKQVKEKKITYSLDEWKIIEERATSVMMKTGTYIKRISVDGQINHYSVGDITQLMNALRILSATTSTKLPRKQTKPTAFTKRTLTN